MPIYSYKCPNDHVTDHLTPMSKRDEPKQCKVCREDAHMFIVPPKIALNPADPAFAGTYLSWERKRTKQMAQERKVLDNHGSL